MKQEYYKNYSEIFDFFSSSKIAPNMSDFTWEFISLLKSHKKRNLKITDVGSGTGYFLQIYYSLLRESSFTAIEPNEDMFNKLESRLNDFIGIDLKKDEFCNYLQYCEKQDVFIFQRSLNSVACSSNKYKDIAKNIYNKTLKYGVVAIYDIPEPIDLDKIYNWGIYQCKINNYSEPLFEKKWRVFSEIQKKFNRDIYKGSQLLFPTNKQKKLFLSCGFSLVLEGNCYTIFKKNT